MLAVLTISGCASWGNKLDQQKNWTVEQFYKNAREELNTGNYAGAVKLYESLEARYPFGRYAQQAQLDIAYANYKDNETASAIAAADRFLKLHPNHRAVDYALYVKGLAYFKPDLGLFGAVLNLDTAERDPKALRDSFDVFKELVTRFPESIYADDARGRMNYLVETLARHDIAVARYYFNRGGYLAATNRAQNVLIRFPNSTVVEQALEISTESYKRMKLPELSDASKRVLSKNYPQNAYLATGKFDDKPLWKVVWNRLW